MKLSNNFYLSEFTKSEIAMKNGFKEQFTPPKEIIENIKLLVENIAEPIREKFGSFSPTSGYRCKKLNTFVGGSKKSEHLIGAAMDETFFKDNKNISKEVFDWILNGGLKKWSTLILEYPDKNCIPRWLHIGYDINNLNNTVLVIDDKNPKGINYYVSKYYKNKLL